MIEDLKPVTVVPVGSTELAGATKVLRKFSALNLARTDAAGLYLMQALRIKQCWSSDFHLGLTDATLATDGK